MEDPDLGAYSAAGVGKVVTCGLRSPPRNPTLGQVVSGSGQF